ncbi:MAG: hypothetical protein R2864_13140 [Syntrophotaleaceae bacterium]
MRRIPPLPLDAEQVVGLCEHLCNPLDSQDELLLSLLAERVPPGVDEAARVKADFLAGILRGRFPRAGRCRDGHRSAGNHAERIIFLPDCRSGPVAN